MEEQRIRKQPAIEKKISSISKEDIRVSIIGTIVSKDDMNYSMEIDDGTGTIKVLCDELYNVGSLVRVIGRPMESDDNLVINSEIISDFRGFDLELYQNILNTCEA